jgi:hypothetical protein
MREIPDIIGCFFFCAQGMCFKKYIVYVIYADLYAISFGYLISITSIKNIHKLTSLLSVYEFKPDE